MDRTDELRVEGSRKTVTEMGGWCEEGFGGCGVENTSKGSPVWW